MKCQRCQQADATVHVKQASDGDVRELHLCAACAAHQGFQPPEQMGLPDFLFGIEVEQATETGDGEDRSCPACHMRESDFRKAQRLGCAACYEAFRSTLAEYLRDMQSGESHVGKVPVSERQRVERAALQGRLNEAVEEQDFEEAARLRDAMRGQGAGDDADGGAP
jgi:protein arginine kinase activator